MEELFENDFFVIIGTITDKDSLTDSIEECGGILSKTINKKTTLAICNDIDDDNNKVELDKVKKNGTIKIITDSFLLDSIKEKKRLNVDDYITKSKASSGNGDSNGTDSGDADEQVSKRIKLDHLISGSVWCGALNYINTGDIYPFYLNIETRQDDKNLSGTIDWPTLDNAKTEFRGVLENDTLKIEEHTQITTTDQVSLPNTYEAKVIHGVKPQIKGSIVYSKPEDNDDPDLKATFNLNLTKPKSANSVSSNNLSTALTDAAAATTTATPTVPLELSYLVDGNQFNGEFEIPYGFNLKIVSRKNQRDIDGTIDWTNLKTKTKFKGELNEKDLSIVLQEYEVLSGDSVEVPITYTGVLSKDKNLITGDYKVDGTSSVGKFKLELVQK